jgi:enoyl-CoA hydratase/carnithine racemase
MSFQPGATVTYEVRDHIAYVQMERPDARNALSDELKTDLAAAFDEAEGDPSVRATVLSGCDCGAFSAGGDLKRIAAAVGNGEAPEPGPEIPDIFKALLACRKPLIAAIDGYAIGGGCEMAIACDIRVATRASSFGMPEPRAGMLGDFGLDNLCRVIPLGEALRIQLTGGRIPAERAWQIGLVQELADDRDGMFGAAAALGAEIVQCAPRAVATIKQVVRAGRNLPIEYARQLSAPFRESQRRSQDAAEGTQAFAEKRPPNWALDAGP